ncbi:MAG: YkgJ family cysteine cluster protein [Methanomethylovorans sp.]|jgi:hypothetical protein|nr:YkgJ family cysteine cluster protein [Methanomethylovorans sp.]
MQFRSTYRNLILEDVKNELMQAKSLEVESISFQIQKTGFSCTQCGCCCRGKYGDNRVMLLPQDILEIYKTTHLSEADFSSPFIPVEVENALNGVSETSNLLPYIDGKGNIHSFGWMLKRKKNGDCFFFESISHKCSIYKSRPVMCQTYPFYMEKCKLYTSECEGLGSFISPSDSLSLARLVLNRYIQELEDLILVYQRYEHFEPVDTNISISLERFKKGYVFYIVHDSEGTHYRCEQI